MNSSYDPFLEKDSRKRPANFNMIDYLEQPSQRPRLDQEEDEDSLDDFYYPNNPNFGQFDDSGAFDEFQLQNYENLDGIPIETQEEVLVKPGIDSANDDLSNQYKPYGYGLPSQPIQHPNQGIQNFKISVRNQETSHTNTDYIYVHENGVLLVRKDYNMRFDIENHSLQCLPFSIRIIVDSNDNTEVWGPGSSKCGHWGSREDTYVTVVGADSTHGYHFVNKKRVHYVDIDYPEQNFFYLKFRCNNSCFRKSKTYFNLDFQLHDKVNPLQISRMLLKVCASPSRDGKAKFNVEAQNDDTIAQKMSVLEEDDRNVYFIPIWGRKKVDEVIKHLSDYEYRDRYFLTRNQSNVCHSSQITDGTEISSWLQVFSMDKYSCRFTELNLHTMMDIVKALALDKHLFKRLSLNRECEEIITKSFLNWFHITCSADPRILNMYAAHGGIAFL